MNCQCVNASPGLRYVPNLLTDHFGRCKMCKGWRPNAPSSFTVREILQHELPTALRLDKLPDGSFAGVWGNSDLLNMARERGRFDVLSTRIHRDFVERFVQNVRVGMNREGR